MASMETVPTKANKSPQLNPFPYFNLIGCNNLRALSKLVLSGHDRSGSNRCAPPSLLFHISFRFHCPPLLMIPIKNIERHKCKYQPNCVYFVVKFLKQIRNRINGMRTALEKPPNQSSLYMHIMYIISDSWIRTIHHDHRMYDTNHTNATLNE